MLITYNVQPTNSLKCNVVYFVFKKYDSIHKILKNKQNYSII